MIRRLRRYIYGFSERLLVASKRSARRGMAVSDGCKSGCGGAGGWLHPKRAVASPPAGHNASTWAETGILPPLWHWQHPNRAAARIQSILGPALDMAGVAWRARRSGPRVFLACRQRNSQNLVFWRSTRCGTAPFDLARVPRLVTGIRRSGGSAAYVALNGRLRCVDAGLFATACTGSLQLVQVAPLCALHTT